MTLLDAPAYNEARERRRVVILYSAVGLLFVLFVGFWLAAGRPVDWPWNWNNHLQGRMTVNAFFKALEKNDLPAAYGIWTHDKDWQKHPEKHHNYTFERFETAWSPDSPDNDYGQIRSHRIAAARMIGNMLQTGTFVNERKSKAINLDYDPNDHTLTFSPEDVQFLEGPGGIS
ncbi:MAG TPA: hypothetical protein VGE85_02460 [Terracidiphilus sp.]|jgi:hypothetical protein